jgi:outer membrane protein assembly factor BamB
MRVRSLQRWAIWISFGVLGFFSLLLAGCGGGGSGGGSSTAAPPYISASVVSFPSGAVPPGLISAGSNTGVSIEVLDKYGGAPISNAYVSVNGAAIAYSPGNLDYEGEINVAPASSVTMNVTVAGSTYIVSGTQFTSYPTISAPTAGATWLSLAANLIAWSSTVTTAGTLYELGVLDTNGQLIGPPGDAFHVFPTTTTSFTVNPGSLTVGSRIVIAGLVTGLHIPNADANSILVIGGFNSVPITIANAPTASLVSIAVTPANPAVVNGSTRQLTATGTYSDSSTRDLTTQTIWTSSDISKIATNTTGLAGGVAYGSATIPATLGSVSGSTVVTVFQANPSPTPPLSQSVAYQIDYAHSGRAVFGTPLTFPASPTWSVTLDGAASYPLIAGNKVFVTTARTSGGSSLYALDQQTGTVVWGPIAISTSRRWATPAYDHGKVFVVDADGILKSFDAVTGQVGWRTQLPGQASFFSSPPTAVNGLVYVGGTGTLFAVDESTGSVLWTAAVSNGDDSSPAVSSDGVFVTYPCQAYKFDPISGASLWHYSGGCSGGGGKTPAYANGLLYMRDWTNPLGLIFDAATGTQTGNFTATAIPAFSTTTGFFLNAGSLKGIDLSSHNVMWTFVGDGNLVSTPIEIDQVVIVGSSSGNVYAVDSATGSQIWSGSAGSGISGGEGQTGFGAGEGYLIVPAGNVLTAWHISGP